jgi:hypothetical protein
MPESDCHDLADTDFYSAIGKDSELLVLHNEVGW